MDYIEVNISIEPLEPWRDLLNADLGDIGFESFLDTESGAQAFVREDEFKKETLDQLIESYSSDCLIKYSERKVESVNWNEEWEKNFDPIYVEEKCVVRASFHHTETKFPYDIVINPKMSFGTGHHPTTYLMIKSMLNLNFEDKEVLDMGSGTGVLAILASKLKAKSVLAIDYDEWAFENCKENIALNDMPNVSTKLGSSELIEGQFYDTILANINLNILLSHLEHYNNALRLNGDILFSGVLEKDVEQLTQSLKNRTQIEVQKIEIRDKWAVIHGIKSEG